MPQNKEFPLGKENYCPKCYFESEKVVLRTECPHKKSMPQPFIERVIEEINKEYGPFTKEFKTLLRLKLQEAIEEGLHQQAIKVGSKALEYLKSDEFSKELEKIKAEIRRQTIEEIIKLIKDMNLIDYDVPIKGEPTLSTVFSRLEELLTKIKEL